MTKVTRTKPKNKLSIEDQTLILKKLTPSVRLEIANKHKISWSLLRKIIHRVDGITDNSKPCVDELVELANGIVKSLKQDA